MTFQEKNILKEIKDILVELRLKTKVLTEDEFKKKVDKSLKFVEQMFEADAKVAKL